VSVAAFLVRVKLVLLFLRYPSFNRFLFRILALMRDVKCNIFKLFFSVVYY
jgi:hypothetical protein